MSLPAKLDSLFEHFRAVSSGLRSPLKVRHLENGQTGINISHHAPEEHTKVKIHSNHDRKQERRKCFVIPSPLSWLALTSAGAVLVGVNKSRDEVRRDGDDEGVGDDGQDANSFQNVIPDSWHKHKLGRRQPPWKKNLLPPVYRCLWPARAEGGATVWQTWTHPNESQWCCWSAPREEPEGTLPQRWW